MAKKKTPFEVWKDKAQDYSHNIDCPDDLWDDNDPYDLKLAAKVAFENGQSPKAFVEEIFAEDIASRENDDMMFEESLQQEEEPRTMSQPIRQPQPGETVMFCSHMLDLNKNYLCRPGTHWYSMEARFIAPNGERGVAQWFNCCDSCYRNLGGISKRLLTDTPIGGHLVWRSTEPIVCESLS